MKKLVIIGSLLIFALFTTISFASEFSIASDKISVSETGTKLTGNVIITFENNKKIAVNADKIMKSDNELLLEGNVEIKSNNFVIHTEKASILTINNTTQIKMDSCELKNT